jgi:hypothetical protein
MFNLTEEQTAIVRAVLSGKNIVCEAVAGAGKTTTVLGLAKMTNKKIIQLTYNRLLKDEVKEKAAKYDNLSVYTYHGFATAVYGPCRDDLQMQKILTNNTKLRRKLKANILVLDEAQDMKMIFFKLICKYFSDMEFLPKILVLGDCRQSIYKFMKADPRFITHMNHFWSFDNLALSQSWRVSREIAWFVNNIMLGKNIIQVTRKSPPKPVIYLSGNIFKDIEVAGESINFINYLVNMIKEMIDNDGIKPDDIFVLTRSVKINIDNKYKPPWKMLLNKLVECKFPCYHSNLEEVNPDLLKNKIAFSTIHAAKGRERKVVIVMGFDSGFYRCEKQPNVYECPNELYVAVTRARDQLILVENAGTGALPFLNYHKMFNNENVKFIGKVRKQKEYQAKIENVKHLVPTRLIKHIDPVSAGILTKLCESLYVKESNEVFVVDTINKITCEFEWTQSGESKKCLLHEDVSAINGLLIPALWYHRINDKEEFAFYEEVKAEMLKYEINNFRSSEHSFFAGIIKRKYGKMRNPKKLNEYLFITNLYLSFSESTTHKLAQINKYDWITDKQIDQCCNYMNCYISSDCTLESKILIGKQNQNVFINDFYKQVLDEEFDYVKVSAVYDIVDYEYNTIWEIKCKTELDLESKLQLGIYAWIYYKRHTEDDKKFKLLNIRSGEVYALVKDFDKLDQMMEILILHNEKRDHYDDDDKFILDCKKIIKQYEIEELAISCVDEDESDDDAGLPVKFNQECCVAGGADSGEELDFTPDFDDADYNIADIMS